MSDTIVSEVLPAETQNQPEPTKDAPEVVKPDAEPKPADAALESPESAEKPEDAADKLRRSMQRRIDKRTADLYQARAQSEQLAQRLAAIEARLQGDQPEQPAAVDPVALAREIATVERVTERSNGVARDGEKRFAGEFASALSTVRDEAGDLFDPSGKPTALGEAILDAEDPAGLLHHLGTNPDLAAELQWLSAAALGRRIGRIEAQMSSKPAPSPVSRAPAPVKPIAAKASHGSLESMSMDEYVAARKAQGARWAR